MNNSKLNKEFLDSAWASMEDTLDREMPVSNSFRWWFILLILLLFGIGGAYYFYNFEEGKGLQESVSQLDKYTNAKNEESQKSELRNTEINREKSVDNDFIDSKIPNNKLNNHNSASSKSLKEIEKNVENIGKDKKAKINKIETKQKDVNAQFRAIVMREVDAKMNRTQPKRAIGRGDVVESKLPEDKEVKSEVKKANIKEVSTIAPIYVISSNVMLDIPNKGKSGKDEKRIGLLAELGINTIDFGKNGGFKIGLVGQKPIWKSKLFVSLGIDYEYMKRLDYYEQIFYDEYSIVNNIQVVEVERETKNYYLGVPLNIEYRFGNRFFVGSGVELSFLVNYNLKEYSLSYLSKNPSENKKTRELNERLGLNAIWEFGYYINPRMRLSTNFGFGIIELEKYRHRNSPYLGFTIGYKLR